MRTLKPQVAKASTVASVMRDKYVFSTRTVDTFATCGFNVRMRKYAQCGPRLTVFTSQAWLTVTKYYC